MPHMTLPMRRSTQGPGTHKPGHSRVGSQARVTRRQRRLVCSEFVPGWYTSHPCPACPVWHSRVVSFGDRPCQGSHHPGTPNPLVPPPSERRVFYHTRTTTMEVTRLMRGNEAKPDVALFASSRNGPLSTVPSTVRRRLPKFLARPSRRSPLIFSPAGLVCR